MSGIGKCSLTAALPIISACGVECNPVPTAVLSSHTGGLEGYTFRDLTDDLIPYATQWRNLGIKPDVIYSGYLGSIKQIDYVISIINMFDDCGAKVVVDPAMADMGQLYTGFDSEFVNEMKALCSQADIITPNLTEAALLTGIPYEPDYSPGYLDRIIPGLESLTKRFTVITGISDIPGKTGCLVCDKENKRRQYFTTEKCEGVYYGTGDVFASVLTALTAKGADCFKAAEKAMDFTYKSIRKTFDEGTDTRLGVAFEGFLNELTGLEI